MTKKQEYESRSLLPLSIEAEKAILGAIIVNQKAYHEAAEQLKPEDFFLDSNRRIYARMGDLTESSRAIDHVTLAEELHRHREFETIGGYAYISSLIDGVPDSPSIESYIQIVRDKAVLRGLINATTDTARPGNSLNRRR